MGFVVKIKEGDRKNIIEIPEDYFDYLELKPKEFIEVIIQKRNAVNTTYSTNIKREDSNYISKRKLEIGKFVRETMKELAKKGLLNKYLKDLTKLSDKSARYFGLPGPMLVKLDNKDDKDEIEDRASLGKPNKKKHLRYYIRDIIPIGDNFYLLSNHWYKQGSGNSNGEKYKEFYNALINLEEFFFN